MDSTPARTPRNLPLVLAIAMALGAPTAFAQQAPAQPQAGTPGTASPQPGASADDAKTLDAVTVTGKLDASRNKLAPDIGSSQYTLSRASIEKMPNGGSTPLNEVLLQAPGVVQDSFGQLHVRGDHANLQYRINGIIIPESISGFGQTLDTRSINKVSLLTGALPAQYGYRTAGVIDITTQTGAQGTGGSVGVTAGSFGTLNPFAEFHGNSGAWSWFATGGFQKDDIGIENPTAARDALHDHTDQSRMFGSVSYVVNDSTRVSVMFGSSNNRFQIPDNPDQQPAYSLIGVPDFNSADLDERQREATRFGTVSLQGSFGYTDYQISIGQRYSSIYYRPDPVGDLIFNGVAGTIDHSNRANTFQADFSDSINDHHTIRYGAYLSSERPVSNSTSQVFPADANGNQTSNIPITIIDNAPHITATTIGAYVQDEWQPTRNLTINYGVRADRVSAYVKQGQVSPRLGVVWQATPSTTFHAGYARYFTPPPAELISQEDIGLFQGTTNQVPTNVNAETLSERSHYFDVGVSQKLGDHVTLGLDAYYRHVQNLLDEGQFGTALIFAPFNYARGRVRGIEFTSSYEHGPFSAYFNLATSQALAKQVVTGQYNFSQAELDYIANHWVHLDHDQKLASSAGVSYTWDGTTFGADFLFGSGLRRGFANTGHLPGYGTLNLSAERKFSIGPGGPMSVRVAVINAGDRIYELRDGSGIGVGAPQFGARRGAYVTLTKSF